MCVSSVPLFTDFFLPVVVPGQNLFLAFAVFARVHTCVCMCVVCVTACMRARARVCVFVRARVYRVTLFCIANATEECGNTIDDQSHAFRGKRTLLCISLPKYPKEEEKENNHSSTV